jgi:hypothetical protein
MNAHASKPIAVAASADTVGGAVLAGCFLEIFGRGRLGGIIDSTE